MALSNTATPRYYNEMKAKVLAGELPVCQEISWQMNRIEDKIANPGIYFDQDVVDGFINFCEEELVLTDGSKHVMLPSFKVWAEDLFGWYYFIERSVYEPDPNGHGGRYVKKLVKRRLTKKQYLIVGRGAAKTIYLSDVHGYGLVVDPETTRQITTSFTMRQAEEVLGTISTAITRKRGPVIQFLTEGSINNTTGNPANRPKLYSSKAGIVNNLTDSILQIYPMSIDKLQGLRTKYNTVDEWLSGDIREDVIGAIEQGASKVDDYVIVAASSEGTVRNGPGDSIKMELLEILKGNYYAPHVSIFWYKLDSVEEINHPEYWVKANPNLGVTVSYEAYQLDVEKAEANPVARNDILAKRFGLPMEGYTYFFTYEETLPHRRQNFWGMRCALGIDLSQGDDFCAFTFMFPLAGGRFGVKTRCYISERTVFKLHYAMRDKYTQFMQDGSLIVMPGTFLDMMEVYDDLDEYINSPGVEYDVCCVGYDPYNAQAFIERWCKENSDYGVERVRQGYITESVPLGELKKMAADRQLLFDEELMTFCMGNAIVMEDNNGNRKLLKLRYDDKIDAVSAMMDAWVSYKLHQEMFD